MKRSILGKLLLGFSLIVVALAGLIFLFAYNPVRNQFIETSSTHLERLAVSLEPSVLPFVGRGRFKELDTFVKSLGQRIGTRITVMDPDGVVIADSENDVRTMENHRFRAEMQKALTVVTGTSVRNSPTEHRIMVYVAVPLMQQNKVLCVVRTSIALRSIENLLQSLKREIGWITCATACIVILFAAILFLGFSRPLRDLVLASRRVTKGDFKVRVFLDRRDEFGDLAESFNEMTSRLQFLFDSLNARSEELGSIISSIHEGLLVFDEKRQILMANQSFSDMLGIQDVAGKNAYEVLRNTAFIDLSEKILREKGSDAGEIELRNRIYLCSAVYLPTGGKVVCLFHDVTALKDIERVKRDFVTNVSHELKTPLTAIKGFIETMENAANDEHRRYLEIIGRNTERLIRIVDDLLTLSEMEEKGFALTRTDVDIRQVLKDAVSIFEQKARDKGLAFKLDIGDDVAVIRADAYRLEQLFINLLDNGIKYTEQGSVQITVRKESNNLVIEVEDTGIGIPKEHVPRIFERFYVTDKSRSRKSGGTGLGLSIVKHIVLLHNGTIAVTSTPGHGTKFIVSLPLPFA